MPQRILSISGLRGVIGDGLDPAYLVRFAAGLGSLVGGGPVVLSRDGRSTGEMVRQAVLAGLTSVGCRVLDAGICSTPTCGVLVSHLGAAAGLQITASHNPIEWNGLKPFAPQGSVFDAARGAALIDLLERDAFGFVPWDRLGGIEPLTDPFGPHRERILRLVDAAAIRAKRFKVVLDCNHGSGAVSGPGLLRELGCETVVLGGTADGSFEHGAEPLAENLGGLCEAVRRHGADVGFAQDPDADRLAIVDGAGRYIGEELTLALAVDHVLATRPGPVVVNGSTSRTTADVAARFGCPFHRSYVGEAHVVAKMQSVGATIGGEGNGGVIDPQVGFVRDSFLGMAYVLAGLVRRGGTLAEWVATLPRYVIVKEKLTCPRESVDRACKALRTRYADAEASEGDGLRLDWPDRWVQVRASNTEPILRVIAEAPDEKSAQDLCGAAKRTCAEAVGN